MATPALPAPLTTTRQSSFFLSLIHILDQRLRVSPEIIADIGTVFRDPLSRYFLFLIADQIDILENWMNFIYSVTMFYA